MQRKAIFTCSLASVLLALGVGALGFHVGATSERFESSVLQMHEALYIDEQLQENRVDAIRTLASGKASGAYRYYSENKDGLLVYCLTFNESEKEREFRTSVAEDAKALALRFRDSEKSAALRNMDRRRQVLDTSRHEPDRGQSKIRVIAVEG